MVKNPLMKPDINCFVNMSLYLSASVITLVTLKALLILVWLLMLNEGIALMKHSIAVSALLALLNIGMLLSQVDTWKQNIEPSLTCENINKHFNKLIIHLFLLLKRITLLYRKLSKRRNNYRCEEINYNAETGQVREDGGLDKEDSNGYGKKRENWWEI